MWNKEEVTDLFLGRVQHSAAVAEQQAVCVISAGEKGALGGGPDADGHFLSPSSASTE
jgi:hypothetical protein